MPYTYEYRAYAHVIAHHNTGATLIGDVLVDPIYDAFVYSFGMLYKHFNVIFLSYNHYLLMFVMEAFTAVVGTIFIAIHLYLASFLLALIPDRTTHSNPNSNPAMSETAKKIT